MIYLLSSFVMQTNPLGYNEFQPIIKLISVYNYLHVKSEMILLRNMEE